MVEYKIKFYDGETVVFRYKDEDNKCTCVLMLVLKFIWKNILYKLKNREYTDCAKKDKFRHMKNV